MAVRRLIASCLAFGVFSAQAQSAQQPLVPAAGGTDECHNTCTALVEALGESKTFYGVLPNDFRETFFSARQSEVTPACVVQPSSPDDVSIAIQIINQRACHFAVKSGGHAMFAGASNAIGGVTIDFKYLNGIELNEDQSIARIGPGNRWAEVYKTLEPQGLTVAGGRVSDVGVGGFMLGGGISFLSRFHGWASDNVRNYEVVLGNGSISNINYDSYPDLFWALRGGGSNFGIVTCFDLETFRLGPVWAGMDMFVFSDVLDKIAQSPSIAKYQPKYFSKLYATETIGRFASRIACAIGRCTTTEKFIDAFVKMARKGEHEDDIPYMGIYASFAYMPQFDWLGGSVCMVHHEPINNPPAFKDFDAVAATKGGKIRNLTNLMAEIDPWNPRGLRTLYAAMTIKVDKAFLTTILELFIEVQNPIKHIPGIFSGYVLQPITQIARANRDKNGGNPFNIKEEDGSLIILSIFPQWKYAEDDAAVQAAFSDFMDKITALAKERDVFHPWIYQNYANISQDVFGGYGEENRQKLREIQKKYDPERVYSKLRTGYFQL